MIIKNYTWDYIKKYPEQTKRLLGIDPEQLEKLIELGKFIHNRNTELTVRRFFLKLEKMLVIRRSITTIG